VTEQLPQTFMSAGRSATVREHQGAWLLEWNGSKLVYTDEQRAIIDARLYVFEGMQPLAAKTVVGLLITKRQS
jgi:hypothetical protein